MQKLKNQNGYALLVVLLLIVLVGIFTPVLMTKLFSNVEQIQKAEEKLQSDKLILMGKMYMDAAIDETINECRNLENAFQCFRDKIVTYQISESHPKIMDDRQKFWIINNGINGANELNFVIYSQANEWEDNKSVTISINSFE